MRGVRGPGFGFAPSGRPSRRKPHATAQDRLPRGMARRAQGASEEREGADPHARSGQRGAARAALGQGREALRLRHHRRQEDARRPVRRATASSSSIISCGGTISIQAAPAARSRPITPRARSCIWRITMSATCASRARRSPSSPPTRSGMGWTAEWVSSWESDFNYDYHVSFTKERARDRRGLLQLPTMTEDGFDELPGLSVFFKDEAGDVFHTYSSYARGNEEVIGAFIYLDITPKGRNEKEIMDWVKRHDEYDATEPYPVMLRKECVARRGPFRGRTMRNKPKEIAQWPMSMDLSCRCRRRTLKAYRTHVEEGRQGLARARRARLQGMRRRRREDGQMHLVSAQREAEEERDRGVLLHRLQVARRIATAASRR